MEKIKRIAQEDGYDTIKALGKIDDAEYFAVYNLNDELGDIWCYINYPDGSFEKVFMGMLMIGDEKACEDFEKNDPVGRKRKFLADNFDIFK